MNDKQFDVDHVIKTYGDHETSVWRWKTPPGKKDHFSSLRDALLFVKAESDLGIVYEIFVHHDGHDLIFSGDRLDLLVAAV